MNRRLIQILVPVTILLYAWPFFDWISHRHTTSPTFTNRNLSPAFKHEHSFMKAGFITPASKKNMVHAAALCELPDGRLAAVWYGGSREGAKDVAIWYAEGGMDQTDAWSQPRVLVNRSSATRELGRYIKKVGNPVIFTGPDRRVWLIYVTVTVGGWSGSSLNLKMSEDGGLTWQPSRRLTLSPLFNISELVRTKPVNLTQGKMVLPIYHECIGNFPELLWIEPKNGPTDPSYRKTRMAGGTGFIQPCVVPYTPSRAAAFYRCTSKEKAIGRAFTTTVGTYWSSPQILDLPNPDAGLDALLLSHGRILMAFNDTPSGRGNLRLALSDDQGMTWRRIATIENHPGEEFSYPYMISTKNGWIHLVYTWRRKRIKHVVFNEAWVNKQAAEWDQ
ncbi:MAG: sialidase family protein [Deltaproteobacteria bacterium]|nr:sialidase family protein [Deltaproteobacteria bacterium]